MAGYVNSRLYTFPMLNVKLNFSFNATSPQRNKFSCAHTHTHTYFTDNNEYDNELAHLQLTMLAPITCASCVVWYTLTWFVQSSANKESVHARNIQFCDVEKHGNFHLHYTEHPEVNLSSFCDLRRLYFFKNVNCFLYYCVEYSVCLICNWPHRSSRDSGKSSH